MQETHLKKTKELRLRHKNYSLIYRSPANSKQKGVALLFRSSAKFQTEAIKAEGRVIMVKGKLRGRLCTFISAYAPNTGQAVSLTSLLDRISKFAEGPVVLMGDFNLTWHAEMDSTHHHREATSNFPKGIKQKIQALGLRDAWRTFYPTTNDYTFFSHVHLTYSRLEHIFISQSLLGSLQAAKIFPITISDHSLVTSSLSWGCNGSGTHRWQFPISVTRDRILQGELRASISEYFELNQPQATSPQNN